MFAIDRKIRIERQNVMSFMDFGHPHDACISERHGPVPIFLMQFAQGWDVLLNAKCNLDRTIFQKSEQRIVRPGEVAEQIHRLGQYWFTDQQRWIQLLNLGDDPPVMLFRPV
jgi:hypothetical protein